MLLGTALVVVSTAMLMMHSAQVETDKVSLQAVWKIWKTKY
jgi:hypothetical protein